jgi:hypothetical protein
MQHWDMLPLLVLLPLIALLPLIVLETLSFPAYFD